MCVHCLLVVKIRPVWPKTPVLFACVCSVPWLQHIDKTLQDNDKALQDNNKALLLQDVLEGELTFRDGLSGQPSTCYYFSYL